MEVLRWKENSVLHNAHNTLCQSTVPSCYFFNTQIFISTSNLIFTFFSPVTLNVKGQMKPLCVGQTEASLLPPTGCCCLYTQSLHSLATILGKRKHFVWPLFFFRTALNLHGTDSKRCSKHYSKDLVHIDVIVTQVTVSIHKESLILLVLHVWHTLRGNWKLN